MPTAIQIILHVDLLDRIIYDMVGFSRGNLIRHEQESKNKAVSYEVTIEQKSIVFSIYSVAFEWNDKVLIEDVCPAIDLFLGFLLVDLPANRSQFRDIVGSKTTPEQYLSKIRVISDVDEDIVFSSLNDRNDVNAVYMVDWIKNAVPLYSNLTLSADDFKTEITDDVMFVTQTVSGYLNEDINNRIMFTPVLRSGEVVKRSWSVVHRDMFLHSSVKDDAKRYGCHKLDTLRAENIDTKNPLIDLQAFGSYNMWVPKEEFNKLTSSDSKIPAYALIPSWKRYASLVSSGVFDDGLSAVSRYHCQDTGRKDIKVYNIVPTYGIIEGERETCVASDQVYRKRSGDCQLAGLSDDSEFDNCCTMAKGDENLLNTLFVLSAYRNVDFPNHLKYLKEIFQWYISLKQAPSPWTITPTIEISDEEDSKESDGIIEVIQSLRPTIMNFEITYADDAGEKFRKILSLLDAKNMQDIVIKPLANMAFVDFTDYTSINKTILEIVRAGLYPRRRFSCVLSTSEPELFLEAVSYISKAMKEKENFELQIEYIGDFPHGTPELDETSEADGNRIKTNMEERFRQSGYSQKASAEGEQEHPFIKDQVTVKTSKYWLPRADDDNSQVIGIKLFFSCEIKLPVPRKYVR